MNRNLKNEYLILENKTLLNDFNKKSRCLLWLVKFGKYKEKNIRFIDMIINDYSYFEWCVEKGMINENVLQAVSFLKELLNKSNNII